jgi:RNA polymerase sigma-70 factor (ECF subfamily)
VLLAMEWAFMLSFANSGTKPLLLESFFVNKRVVVSFNVMELQSGISWPMTQSDEVLINRCRRGDESSFDILFDRYKARIYTFILRFVKDQKTAEDILQETFIRVFRKSRHFKHRAKFSTWLYTIAANCCKDELKRRKRRETISLDAPVGDPNRETPLLTRIETLPDLSDGPRTEAEKQELGSLLLQVLSEMPENSRLVLELHIMQGLRYREVAKILGCPVGTVQSRTYNAIQQLRKKVRSKLKKPV